MPVIHEPWKHFRIGTLSWVLNVTTATSKYEQSQRFLEGSILDGVICRFLMFRAFFCVCTLQNLLSGWCFASSIDITNVRSSESRCPAEQTKDNYSAFVCFHLVSFIGIWLQNYTKKFHVAQRTYTMWDRLCCTSVSSHVVI